MSSPSRRFKAAFFATMTLIASLPIAVNSFVGDDPVTLQQQAIQRIDGYLDHFRKTGDRASRLMDLQQADVELTASYKAFLARGKLEPAALSLIKRGDIVRFLEQWPQAIAFYQQAYQLAERAAHLGYQAMALMGRATAEVYGLHDYGSASIHIEQAIRLSASVGNQKELFNSLDLMARIQINRGELNAAAETLSRAFSIVSAIEDQTVLFYAHFDRATLYLRLAEKCDYVRTFEPCYEAVTHAQFDYEHALALARQLGYTGLAQMTEESLRTIEVRRELIEMGEYIHKQHLQITTIFRPQKPSDVLVHEQFITGSPDRFPPGLLGIIQQSGVFSFAGDAQSFYTQGLFHQLQGENDAALTAYLKAVELLEADRRSLRDDISRGTFLEDKIEFYYKPILHLLERRRVAEAFQLLERSKARGMADLLASKTLTLSRPKEAELYAESLKVRAHIGRLQQVLFIDRGRADRDRYADRIARGEGEIRRLEDEHRQLLSRMTRNAPKLQPLMVSDPVSLQQLQQSMKRDHYEMIQYLALESSMILWHIGGDAVHVKSVSLPRSALIKKVSELRSSLLNKDGTFDEQVAREMFLYLIQPVLQWIKTEHLVIIPHEDLYYVPFQVFQDPSDRTYLGERFRISYAPSATIFLGLRKAGDIAGGKLLAVANPTIGAARQEVNFIAQLYPGRHKAISDVLVSEADLKSWIANYSLLHFSVHGKFRPEEPLLSYLELSAGGQDDGKLTAVEMFGLPLEQSRLVVLSACETGQAEATHANEVLGMVRALLYAGANTLILSSWRVDATSTALWMQAFYKEAQTRPVGEAARLALAAVKGDPHYNHPYYWGPFLLIGR